jgi:hypothetical protein
MSVFSYFAIVTAVALLEGNKQDCRLQQDGADLPCRENNNSFGVRGVGRGLLATTFFWLPASSFCGDFLRKGFTVMT